MLKRDTSTTLRSLWALWLIYLIGALVFSIIVCLIIQLSVPIDHPDDVFGGGLLDGDEVKYDETTHDRNGKLKAINVVGGTGSNSWGKGDEGKGDSWGKGGSGKGDRKGKSDGWGKGDWGRLLTQGRQRGQGQL